MKHPPAAAMPLWQRFFYPQRYCIFSFVLVTVCFTASVRAEEGVVKKVQVIRGAEMTLHSFYKDGQLIAQYKESPSKGQFDIKGTIPDGKVRVVDEYKKTEGEQFYRRGKFHGINREYYPDGKVKSEAMYLSGVLQYKKEFYPDGTLRFDVDYQKARPMGDSQEVGVGKLYYPNGNLKYEWNFTVTNSTGFRKSYNRDGQLRYEAYYDKDGEEVRSETYTP